MRVKESQNKNDDQTQDQFTTIRKRTQTHWCSVLLTRYFAFWHAIVEVNANSIESQ